MDNGLWLGLIVAGVICAGSLKGQQLAFLTTSPLPTAHVDQQYSTNLLARGGFPPYSWGVVSGSLPSNLVLNGISGQIAGTPNTPGIYSFSIRVGDAGGSFVTGQFSLVCQGTISVFGTPPNGVTGSPYTSSISLSGGAPPYAVSLQSGLLPPGLTLDSSTGAVSGTPSTAGVYPFVLVVTDKTGAQNTLAQSITITPTPPTVLSDGFVGRSYSGGLAGNLRGTYTSTLLSGKLPDGLSVSQATNAVLGPSLVLTGVPSSVGNFDFALRIQLCIFMCATSDQSFHITIRAPLSLATTLVSGTAGQNYSSPVATGGFPPYNVTLVSGAVPAGLPFVAAQTSVKSADGSIQGLVQESGQFAFTLSVTDSGSKDISPVTLSQGYRLTVVPGLSAVLNSASYALPPALAGSAPLGTIAPGEIVALFGNGMGPAALTVSIPGASAKIPSQISGARVLFDGIAAPLLYASAGQIAALVPYELDGKQTTQVNVEYNGLTSAQVQSRVAPSALGIFTFDGSGLGQVAGLNTDLSINSPSNRAERGSVMVLYATGEGQTIPAGQTGTLTSIDLLPVPKLPVSVFIDGIPCEILYSGETPTVTAGLLQLNVRIPLTARSGSSTPVYIVSNGVSSQAGTTVSLK